MPGSATRRRGLRLYREHGHTFASPDPIGSDRGVHPSGVLLLTRVDQLAVVLREDRADLNWVRSTGRGVGQSEHVFDDTQAIGRVDQDEHLRLVWSKIVEPVHHTLRHVDEATWGSTDAAIANTKLDFACEYVKRLGIRMVQVRGATNTPGGGSLSKKATGAVVASVLTVAEGCVVGKRRPSPGLRISGSLMYSSCLLG
jgi:hypothetical protein